LEKGRKLIFISHAVPTENYLAVWLASKLRLLGYEIWVDKEDLRSGSAFWNDIDKRIRLESLRFIPLVSEKYIENSKIQGSGVFLELQAAQAVKGIDNYILPIRSDFSNHNNFPLITLGINSIDFNENWGTGLKKLLKEFEIQGIPRHELEPNVLSQWHKYQGIHGEVLKRPEWFGSNWIECSLPKSLSIYKFYGDAKRAMREIPFACSRDKDFLLGFFNDNGLDLRTEFREDVEVKDFIYDNSFILNNGEIIKDTENKFTQLMNKALNTFFYSHEQIKCRKRKDKTRIYYTVRPPTKSGRYPFKIGEKKGWRTLKGKHGNIYWNYGLSFQFQLKPFPHFVANAHILTSNESGFIDDDRKNRRSIPKEWFNRHWYDRIFSFMNYANNGRNEETLEFASGREIIELYLQTVQFKSAYGYEES